MTAGARRKADACFALARSTTFEGERESAIARGTAIAEKAGLSLDLFDIPGRVRGTARKPGREEYVDDLFKRRPPPDYSAVWSDEINKMAKEMTDRLREDLRRSMEHERARQEAHRRARDADRVAREKSRETRSALADVVANVLFAKGWSIYFAAKAEDGSRRWHVMSPNGGTLDNVDDDRLCRIGIEHGALDAMAEELRKRADAFP